MIGQAILLLSELIVLFVGVAFVIQLAQRRMGADRLRKWMGGTAVASALKGVAVGFLTPFCTYSAIPLLIGLRQAGVPPAGYVAFIVAAPVLDPVLFGALTLIVGIKVALIYLAVTFTAAMMLALIAQAMGISRYLKPLPVPQSATPAMDPHDCAASGTLSCQAPIAEHPWRGLRTEAREAGFNAVGLLRSLGPLLLLGVAIGLAIESFASPDTVARITGDNITFAIPTAAALGTPLYFNTGLFIPIADSLRTAGVGIGAIVALTIAGAGANVPEFVILSRLARPRLIGIFLGYVFAVAMAGGLLAQAIAT